MGTVSLVFGVVLIITGLGIIFKILDTPFSEDIETYVILILASVIATPFFVVGALLLRKYDSDKKNSQDKEKKE